jgi:hypothetical protein
MCISTTNLPYLMSLSLSGGISCVSTHSMAFVPGMFCIPWGSQPSLFAELVCHVVPFFGCFKNCRYASSLSVSSSMSAHTIKWHPLCSTNIESLIIFNEVTYCSLFPNCTPVLAITNVDYLAVIKEFSGTIVKNVLFPWLEIVWASPWWHNSCGLNAIVVGEDDHVILAVVVVSVWSGMMLDSSSMFTFKSSLLDSVSGPVTCRIVICVVACQDEYM